LSRKNTIPDPVSFDDSSLIHFSFKHLDLFGNSKFTLKHCSDGYAEKFLTRLKDVCGMRLKDFRGVYQKELRNHTIDWAKTSEPGGFAVNAQLKAKEAWQFELTKSEHGRVHGILVDNVFYVIWLDPKHHLYPVR